MCKYINELKIYCFYNLQLFYFKIIDNLNQIIIFKYNTFICVQYYNKAITFKKINGKNFPFSVCKFVNKIKNIVFYNSVTYFLIKS